MHERSSTVKSFDLYEHKCLKNPRIIDSLRRRQQTLHTSCPTKEEKHTRQRNNPIEQITLEEGDSIVCVSVTRIRYKQKAMGEMQ